MREIEIHLKCTITNIRNKKSTQFGDTANSKLEKHAWENDHRLKWNEAKILQHESHYYK